MFINEKLDTLIQKLSNGDVIKVNDSGFYIIQLDNNPAYYEWLEDVASGKLEPTIPADENVVPKINRYHSKASYGGGAYVDFPIEVGDDIGNQTIYISLLRNYVDNITTIPDGEPDERITNTPNRTTEFVCCDMRVFTDMVNKFPNDVNSSGFMFNGSFFTMGQHLVTDFFGMNNTIRQYRPIGPYAFSKHKNGQDYNPPRRLNTGYGNEGRVLSGVSEEYTDNQYNLKACMNKMGFLICEDMNKFSIKRYNEVATENGELRDEYIAEGQGPYEQANKQLLMGTLVLYDGTEHITHDDYNTAFIRRSIMVSRAIDDPTDPEKKIADASVNDLRAGTEGKILPLNTTQNIFDVQPDMKNSQDPVGYGEVRHNENVVFKRSSDDAMFIVEYNSGILYTPYCYNLLKKAGPGAVPPAMPMHASDVNPRTCVMIDYYDNVMFMSIEGRKAQIGGSGYDLPQIAKITKAMGAKHVINLDGGGSSSFIYKIKGTERADTVKQLGIEHYQISNIIKILERDGIPLAPDEPEEEAEGVEEAGEPLGG
jgi:hypothetical protein